MTFLHIRVPHSTPRWLENEDVMPSQAEAIPTILVTGTLGAGKTATIMEIAEILTQSRVPHAAIDLDNLSECWPRPEGDVYNEQVMFKNLACVWANYKGAGANHLALAGVLEDRVQLARYREAVPGAEIVVCQVLADPETIVQRLTDRESGIAGDRHLSRSAELAERMTGMPLADFVVGNEGRSIREVALEVLDRAGWPPGLRAG